MKNGIEKRIILVFAFILFAQYVHPQATSGESNTLVDISLRFTVPELPESEGMAFINIGYGRYFPIVPHLISPGIYADFGIGVDWFGLFSDDDTDKEKTKNKEYKQFGLNLGFRLFNLIEIGMVDINTFIGYNFILGQLDARASGFIHTPVIGASIAIGFVAIEYCYYIPTRFSSNVTFHHFTIAFHGKL